MISSHNNHHQAAAVAVVHRHHHLTQAALLTLTLIRLHKRRESCDDVYSFVLKLF